MSGTNKYDIMDDLLKGVLGDTPDGIAELGRLIHRKADQTRKEKAKPREAPSPGGRKGKGEAKKKTTHYLSEEICGDLDSAKDRINMLAGRHSKISKSKIVGQALKMILRDFEEQGENSPLIQEILKDFPEK